MTLSPRTYTIEEYTQGLCPECWHNGPHRSDDADTFVPAMLVSHSGGIYLRRYCPTHGSTESLYEESAELWRLRHGWQTPTLEVVPDHDGAGGLASYAHGLPPSHGQHSCILLLNIIDSCNYSCPTCYASASGPGTPPGSLPSLDEIERTVTSTIEKEGGRLSVLMLSGGEPTIRGDLPELLERLARLPITRILLNTNGRRIVRDPGFLETLHRLEGRLEVYLQFDGLTERPYEVFRGENVLAEKIAAFEALQKAGIFTTLVATVGDRINDQELGDLVRFGMAAPRCTGIAFQPVFGSGRGGTIDPMRRITPTGVIRRLQEQAPEAIDGQSFIPLPCSHRDCCDIAYFIRDGQDSWRSLVGLIGRDELKKWIHLVSNTISFENASEAVRSLVADGVPQRVFSEQQRTSSLKLAGDVFRMCGCVPGVSELLGSIGAKSASQSEARIAERTFRITVKMFMDVHTFHEHRIRQCCVHVGTFEPNPRRYSFCWRWLFADADDHPKPQRELTSLPLKV